MKYKFFSVLAILVICSYALHAQVLAAKQAQMKMIVDSMKLAAMSDYAKRYPVLRQGGIATDFTGSGSVKAQLNGKPLFEGDQTITRIRSFFNVPIAQWGKNTFTSTITYQQQSFHVDHITNAQSPVTGQNINVTKATVGISASYSRSDSLFGRPVNYAGTIAGVTNELSSIKRVNYIGSITFPIKRTPYNSLTLGLVVIIDPSSPVPAFPIISYWHRFKTSDLELFVDMPSRLVLRKQFTKRSWATIGSELGTSLSFFDINQPGLPQNAIYSRNEIRSGINFEYLLTRKLVVGINGGVASTTASRMFGYNDKSSDYFFKTSNASVPYISFTVSFLPFLKSLSR